MGVMQVLSKIAGTTSNTRLLVLYPKYNITLSLFRGIRFHLVQNGDTITGILNTNRLIENSLKKEKSVTKIIFCCSSLEPVLLG